MRICKICEKEKELKFFAKNGKYYRYICKSCEAKTQKERVRKTIEYVQSLKIKCLKCNYNKCKEALEFHHVNSNEKEFNIIQWASKRSFTKHTKLMIDNEVKKCIVLCANCHRETHYT